MRENETQKIEARPLAVPENRRERRIWAALTARGLTPNQAGGELWLLRGGKGKPSTSPASLTPRS